MNSILPLCFYPTQKLILDDDHAFLESVLLKTQQSDLISMSSAQKALSYLFQEGFTKKLESFLITIDKKAESSATEKPLNISIDKIKKEFFEASGNEVSILLIDYHMPEMSGLDFLEKIKDIPIKKILLTGEINDKIAIDAFNLNLVDFYIRKSDPDFIDKIKTTINTLEWQYFTDSCEIIKNIPDLSLSYLSNKKFITHFQNFMKEKKILSYCLIDLQGNFILENKDHQKIHFLIRNKNQLHEMSLVAEEDGASFSVIKALKENTAIPFFGDKQFWQIPASQWDLYLHPAQPIDNDEILVWSQVS